MKSKCELYGKEKVYLVLNDAWYQVLGVFTTKDKAEKFIDIQKLENHYYNIEEWWLDP